MTALRIAVATRFPLAERTEWKRAVVDSLHSRGHDVCVAFGSSSIMAHVREALRRKKLHRGSREISLISSAAGQVSKQPHPRLSAYCRSRGIPVGCFDSINSHRAQEFFKSRGIELLVLCGAEVVKRSVLEIPRWGTINAHYGPLPRFRGMSAQEWCLFHREQPAVTVHAVERGIDLGDLLMTRALDTAQISSWPELRVSCQKLAAELLIETVDAISSGSYCRTPQNPDDGRQYFAIHPRLLALAAEQLQRVPR